MQINFSNSGSVRPQGLRHNPDPRVDRGAPPALGTRQEPSNPFLPASTSSRGTSSRDSVPQFHHHHDAGAELTPALRDAVTANDWPVVEAALEAAPNSGLEDRLMQHAARAGAARIVFRLQSINVSPFSPDATACAFYTALKCGNGKVAAEMLNYESVANQKSPRDLKPYMEAAVEDGAGQAIAWLVGFSIRKNCEMPFGVLKDAIVNKNPRQVEIMISHPAFAEVLDDPESEYLFLCEAVRRSDTAVLTALLARKRSAGNVIDLCRTTDDKGDTLLHVAAARGNLQKLKLIMDANPDIRREGASDSFIARLMRGDHINLKNKAGKTARTLANDAGHAELVAMLDARGARA